jgi:hypothetical protein
MSLSGALSVGASYPIFANGAVPVQPTCAVSAGGGVGIGAKTYQIVPIWQNNAAGISSPASATCTTSSGQQTVTVNWTVVAGNPVGYDIYENNLRIRNTGGVGATACNGPQITPGSTNSIVLIADTNCGLVGPAAVPAGGPSLMDNTKIAAPAEIFGTGPIASGTAAALTGTGACATFSNQVGGQWAGSAKCTAATAASTLTITFSNTAPNGWTCDVWDETTRANLFQQTAHATTSCTLTVTSVTQNDIFVFKAIAF